MATLHVTWIKTAEGRGDNPGGVIDDIISAEAITTSGSAAASSAKPALATHAICVSYDDNHYVNQGPGNTAAVGTGVLIPTGMFQVLRVEKGNKISAIVVA